MDAASPARTVSGLPTIARQRVIQASSAPAHRSANPCPPPAAAACPAAPAVGSRTPALGCLRPRVRPPWFRHRRFPGTGFRWHDCPVRVLAPHRPVTVFFAIVGTPGRARARRMNVTASLTIQLRGSSRWTTGAQARTNAPASAISTLAPPNAESTHGPSIEFFYRNIITDK